MIKLKDLQKSGFMLKIVNIIVYCLFLGSNVYSVAGPHDTNSPGKDTYITPAPWAFLIWTLIHLLLSGTMIRQFTPSGKKVVVDGISWRFPLLCILNAIYVHLRASRNYVFAFVFALLVSSVVTHIYYTLMKHHSPPSNTMDDIFVNLPFSLYHGWTTILVVMAAFEAFGVDVASQPAGLWTKVFVCLALIFLEATAGAYSYSSYYGDLPGALTITWSLFAIFVHQDIYRSVFIHWTVLVFAVLSLFWVGKGIRIRFFQRERCVFIDEERTLLGGHR